MSRDLAQDLAKSQFEHLAVDTKGVLRNTRGKP